MTVVPAQPGWRLKYTAGATAVVPILFWSVETDNIGRVVMTPIIPGTDVRGVPALRSAPPVEQDGKGFYELVGPLQSGTDYYSHVVPWDEKETKSCP